MSPLKENFNFKNVKKLKSQSENESTIILQHNISCFDEDLNCLEIHESSTVHTYKFIK